MTRTRRALALAVVLLTGALALPVSSAPPEARPLIQGVDVVGFTVSDVDRSVDFFCRVLDFEKVSDVEVAGEAYEHLQGVFGLRMRVVRMRLGDEQIELTEYLAPQGRSIPEDARSSDRSFQHVAIIVSDMQAAYRRLREHKVRHASSGPQRLPDWNQSAGGIEAFYFKDPDGHPLEILSFPPGKGLAKWHGARTSGPDSRRPRLFLGIDHTAIVVGDTDASLRFYRDRLGLSVAGHSENHGTEQEHLNNVFGARLRITALRAVAGPGIELLEYLAPRDGRPYPPDLKANDIAHWQTTLMADGVEPAWRPLREAGVSFVSPGSVALPEPSLGFSKAVMVRDPDGHAVRVVQR